MLLKMEQKVGAPTDTSAYANAIRLNWEGPFLWPHVVKPQSNLISLLDSPLASSSGVYLWTVEHDGGFLIYAAGITRGPFKKRFQSHMRNYLKGVYTLFDIPSLQRGIRKEIWHGFWSRKRTIEKKKEYDSRHDELRNAAEVQLAAFRVFVAKVDPVPRLPERIEAAIMAALYRASGPASDIPDRGMKLAPRWPEEEPIRVTNISNSLLHALPAEMEV